MTWPAPEPGLVIRYAYLWSWEAQAGREEGMKDRPCAIILANGHGRVIVLPITHTAPESPEDGLELPHPIKLRLGLDDGRSWVILTECNDFTWPGPDLRPLAGPGPESVGYGLLPPRLFRAIRDRFMIRVRTRRANIVQRTS